MVNVITAVIVQIIVVIAIKSSNCFKKKKPALRGWFFSIEKWENISRQFFVWIAINNIKVSSNSQLIINEVFPNPSTGSEWIEISYLGENIVDSNDYRNFTISDEKRIIYTFQGDEVWSNNFLVIEVAGLNNDQDSVILKNAEELVIDQMSYTLTEKNLSWLRINPNESVFILGEASPLCANYIPPSPTPNPNPTVTPMPTSATTATPSSMPSPSITSPSINANPNIINAPPPTATLTNTNQNNNDTNNQEIKTNNREINKQLSQEELAQVYFANYQNYHNLQISYTQEKQFPQTRLVFLGQKILKPAIIDAIIGSSLLVLAAILLSYENKAKRKTKDISSLF